ncbi:MAG: hypothetical protein ACRDIY_10320 [Chloroflexota bacterium]
MLRRALTFLWVLLAALLVPSGLPPATLGWRLARITRQSGFEIWSWELQTLSTRIGESLVDRRSMTGGPSVVRRYAELSQQEARARSERDNQWARRGFASAGEDAAPAQRKLDAIDSQLDQIRPAVEATISQQIGEELRRENVRSGLVTWRGEDQFPFRRPEIVPGVFFQLGPLPDLLVVAPRDRIELIGSVLVQASLGPNQIDGLEQRADGLDVSSIVTGIGGLAAYPSMVPDDGSVQDLLITVAHEWTHHYLALHPLGMSYFNSYGMREINETVADMVGHEVGEAVYARDYAPTDVAPPVPPPTLVSSGPARPDFWTLMRGIRLTVEGYLARHDVAGADAYMARSRQELALDGYYVRRLNTAYLAFFGSYAATANPYEAKLRLLRARSGSLVAFLDRVSTVRTPADLDRRLSESATDPS